MVDVFAGSLRARDRESGLFNELVSTLSRCWGVPACDTNSGVLDSYPQIHTSNSQSLSGEQSISGSVEEDESNAARGGRRQFTVIGRATLVTSTTPNTDTQDGTGLCQQFALDRQSLRMLERLAVCVNHAEPVLLVGETGVSYTGLWYSMYTGDCGALSLIGDCVYWRRRYSVPC